MRLKSHYDSCHCEVESKYQHLSLVDQHLVEQQLVDQQLVDQQLVDQHLVDQQFVDQQLVDQQLVDQLLVDQQLVELRGNVLNVFQKLDGCFIKIFIDFVCIFSI